MLTTLEADHGLDRGRWPGQAPDCPQRRAGRRAGLEVLMAVLSLTLLVVSPA